MRYGRKRCIHGIKANALKKKKPKHLKNVEEVLEIKTIKLSEKLRRLRLKGKVVKKKIF